MEKTTQKYERLPPIGGVTYKGNEGTAIGSRSSIEKEIISFINYCRNDADGVAAKFILGDWGEGKTDSYERLIKPEILNSDDYLFFLSASRLANSYDTESVCNFAKFTISEPDRFLIHLFDAIQAKDKNKDLIPKMEKNPKYFLKKALESLLEGNNKKIFIFIDEFEELQYHERTLAKVISGLKEAINGDFDVESLGEDGEFKDRIHFFVSCTPDAYYKIQVKYDYIMGGFDRRVRKIRLTQITKEEGMKFLFDLLKYSYNVDNAVNLPKNLPVMNISLFNTILRVSQRNLGNLTSLFTEIFKSLVNDQMEILTYSKLLELLKNQEITVYGGQTPCIDQNFGRIIQYLNSSTKTKDVKETIEIFKFLIGDLRPISVNEISDIISVDSSKVDRFINNINSDIKENDKIKRSFIKVSPLKSDKTIEDLIRVLSDQEYIKGNKDFHISSIKYSESLEEFKERITYYELNKERELVPHIYLPKGKADIKAIFEDMVNEDVAGELKNIFDKLISDEVCYLASEYILNLVYPTPIPLDTAYFTNEQKKMKLWRYVSHNLSDEYDKNILGAFQTFINKSEIFKLKKNDSIFQLIDPETNTNINTKIITVNGDVKVPDVIKANDILNNDYSINLVLILYNGEFSKEATEALSIRNLGPDDKYQVLGVQLHHSLARKLIFGYKSIKENKNYVDEDLFSGVCREKIEEMNLKSIIRNWFEYQEKMGLLINQIRLIGSPNPKTFGDGLKLYLNYNEPHSPEEIYDLNNNGIFLYKKYGGRKGFIASDFEDSPNVITKVTKDLKENGFLHEEDDKFSVIANPVESRIHEILKNLDRKVSLKELKSYFIIRDRNAKTFQDVFMNILLYKGLVKQSGKKENLSYEINDIEDSLENLRSYYKSYRTTVDNEDFKRLDHYYVRKKYDSKLIFMDEFDEFLTSNYQKAESSHDLLNVNICTKILDNFDEDFKEAIISASEAAPEIINDIKKVKRDLDETIDGIIYKDQSSFQTDFDRNDIIEYKGLMEDINELKEFYNKKLSKDELKIEIEKIESKFEKEYGKDHYKEKLLEIFGFNNENTTNPYFNIKIYLLEQKKQLILEKIHEIERKLEKIKIKLDETEDRINELEDRLKEIKNSITEENKLAHYMYKQLEKADIKMNLSFKPAAESIDLNSLLISAEKSLKIMGENIKLVIKYTDLIENLNEVETKFLDNLDKSRKDLKKLKQICNTKNFEKLLNDFNKEINQLTNKYDEIDLEELRKDIEKRKNLINNIREWSKNLMKYSDEFSFEWEEYQKHNRKSLDNILKTLNILDSKEDIQNKIKHIKYGIDKYKQNTMVNVLESEYSAKELESIKENLIKDALDVISIFFDENERELVLNLKTIDSKWITYDLIRNIAVDKLKMDEKTLDESLESLVKKGFLQKGLSLNL